MKVLRSAAVAASLAAVVVPPVAEASWPGVNGRVSLTQRVPAGEVRANRDIFAYPTGGDSTWARLRLTFSTNNEEQSSWSPDGQWIAFKQLDDVWISRWDGMGLKQLTDFPAEINNTQPSWSPDGRRIIYRSNFFLSPRNVADVWIMNADGGDRHRLVEREGDERYPSISPDGTKVLFRGDVDEISGNGDEEIYTANAADGKGITRLTYNNVEDSSPNWSPDGSRIALQVNVDGINQEIFVMNADGSHPVRLTNNTVHDIGPTWSPDGRKIAFTRAPAPETPGDVWVMNADGTGQRPLTQTDVIEESPDWQPIPVLRDTAGRRVPCGDRSLAPGGIASVVAVGVRCAKALQVAARRLDTRAHGFRCTQTRHSMDQSAVECVKHGQAIAFVIRDLFKVTKRPRNDVPPRAPGVPDQIQALPENDALPGSEED